MQKPSRSVPFFKTVSCSDGVRRSTRHTTEGAVALELQVVREKEEMLVELRAVRERTLAFLEETSGRDLRKYRLPHPFLGRPERVSVAPIHGRA
jgi:hypothetical protein